jgi:hypothetical protein
MIKGQTVSELFPDGKSAAEIIELWSEIVGALNKQGVKYEPAA